MFNSKKNKMKVEKIFAKAILRTQKIREESFDFNKAKKHEDDIYFDFTKCYKITIFEAAEKASKKFGISSLACPIYLLCTYNWNDIQDWSVNITKK